ncbi:MAG: PA domain-containing protein [Betaproteobacteria bacterium]
MNKTLLAAALAVAGTVAFAGQAMATRLVLLNVDPAGEGLNDPTLKAPVGANPGKSVGAQRRIVYQFAMDLWGSVLKSNVDIKVAASFQPLRCDASSGVLGSAGTNWIERDFVGAPLRNTWYHAALADSLVGYDLDPDPEDPADIVSRFSSTLGTPGCLETSSWYYGLDGNTPAGAINFLDVVMHEIGHGLGFSGFMDSTTGELIDFDGPGGTQDTPHSDAYTHNAYDNVRHLRFDSKLMDNRARKVAVTTPGRTVWAGATVNAVASVFLGHRSSFQVTAPANIAGAYAFGTADFGVAVDASNFSGLVKQANDGVGVTTDGCEAYSANFFAGKIALVDRGGCPFGTKALNAQNGGASGVIIANVASSSNPGTAPGMTGGAGSTIPTISLNLADGDIFRSNVGSGLTVGFFIDPNLLQGADDNGRVRLYAPSVVQPGSTFSHIDTDASPNALMEPAISASLNGNFDIDLTPSLMTDIGWKRNGGNAKIRTCDTGVPIERSAGRIPGANVLAADTACTRNVSPARSSSAYKACMTTFADDLIASGTITPEQGTSLRACIGVSPGPSL